MATRVLTDIALIISDRLSDGLSSGYWRVIVYYTDLDGKVLSELGAWTPRADDELLGDADLDAE